MRKKFLLPTYAEVSVGIVAGCSLDLGAVRKYLQKYPHTEIQSVTGFIENRYNRSYTLHCWHPEWITEEQKKYPEFIKYYEKEYDELIHKIFSEEKYKYKIKTIIDSSTIQKYIDIGKEYYNRLPDMQIKLNSIKKFSDKEEVITDKGRKIISMNRVQNKTQKGGNIYLELELQLEEIDVSNKIGSDMIYIQKESRKYYPDELRIINKYLVKKVDFIEFQRVKLLCCLVFYIPDDNFENYELILNEVNIGSLHSIKDEPKSITFKLL